MFAVFGIGVVTFSVFLQRMNKIKKFADNFFAGENALFVFQINGVANFLKQRAFGEKLLSQQEPGHERGRGAFQERRVASRLFEDRLVDLIKQSPIKSQLGGDEGQAVAAVVLELALVALRRRRLDLVAVQFPLGFAGPVLQDLEAELQRLVSLRERRASR